MEPVDILIGIDGADNALFVDMFRQGELDNESVDVGVAVELVDLGQ